MPSTATAAVPATTLRELRAALPPPLQRKLGRARELYREEASPGSAAALPVLDRLLPGGLPRGRLVEIVGRRSSGRFSLALAALAAATGKGGGYAALVDLGDGLAPRSASLAGVNLERLLWLRPRHLAPALAGAEILLHCGFPLVVLDLGSPPVAGGRGAETSWLRLARSAAARGATVMVSTPYRASGTAAGAVLTTSSSRPVWLGSSTPLLGGLRCGLRLDKSRGGYGDETHASYRLLAAEASTARPFEALK